MSRLSPLDTAFLALESAASPKHVAGLGIFEPESGEIDMRELLVQMKAVPATPPFDKKLATSVLTLPSWVEDPDIDLDWHVRHVALPKPGSTADLMAYVSHAHTPVLDRSRPLWEYHLIEGLEGGRFAIYCKIHHAYMDGVTMSRRIVDTFNDGPDDPTVMPIWGRKSRKPSLTEGDLGLLAKVSEGIRSTGQAITSMPQLGGLAIEHGLKALGVMDSALPVPFMAPRSRLNEAMTPARTAGIAEIPLDRVRKAASAASATVNDVLLSIVDGALMAYLDSVGESPDRPLVAQMPISLRREAAGKKGNQITIALVDLATGERDPVRRVEAINRQSAKVKEEYGKMSEWTASTYTLTLQGMAQALELADTGRKLHPLGNIVVSNVIGEQAPRYMAGAKVVGMYPISTIGPGLSANITFYTCGGVVYVGMIAGREAIDDAMFVTGNMVRNFDELERALGL